MIKSSRLSLDQQKTYITFMGSRYNTLAKKYRIMNLTEFWWTFILFLGIIYFSYQIRKIVVSSRETLQPNRLP